MKNKIDIHIVVSGLIAVIGVLVLVKHYYHTSVLNDWPDEEKLTLFAASVYIFFILLPIYVALFGNLQELVPDQSESSSMGKGRKLLNSKKGIEVIYFGLLYACSSALIYHLVNGSARW